VAVEIDKAYTACGRGATWDGLVELERRAYDAAKAAKPDAIVYFSANAEDRYKQSLTGFDSGLYGALANLKRDRFGLSTYPSGVKRPDGRGAMPNDLPSDYFTRVRKMNPAEAPVVIAETGWNSRDLKVGPGGACVVVADSNEVVQDDYLWVLLQSAETQGIELVTWWSHRDLLPEAVMESCYPLAPPPTFSGCANDSWCLGVNIYRRIAPTNPAFGDVVFKGFGSMGLFDREGRSKAGASRWRATTARSVSP